MRQLKRIRIAGWKSIQDQTIELGSLNLLIGANGAGKSNFPSLFRLLNALVAATPGFRNYVAKNGGADGVLHFGSRRTPAAELELWFETETGETRYFSRWASAVGGTLIFEDERVEFRRHSSDRPQVVPLGAGHVESNLIRAADDRNPTAEVALKLLRSCRLFHFHDTSEHSEIRKPCYVEANRFLFPDAGNLASMLYLYKQKHPKSYRLINATIRQIIPDFGEFVLEPSGLNETQILLNWIQKGYEYEFGPHQFSDGSLRFIALTTLLLQPEENLPLLIALDEPELGLHPAALEILAGMAQSAASGCQILFATQSATFLDYFEPENVLVVDSRSGVSEFTRPSTEQLRDWLTDYTLGQVWEKNVIGGGPYG